MRLRWLLLCFGGLLILAGFAVVFTLLPSDTNQIPHGYLVVPIGSVAFAAGLGAAVVGFLGWRYEEGAYMTSSRAFWRQHGAHSVRPTASVRTGRRSLR